MRAFGSAGYAIAYFVESLLKGIAQIPSIRGAPIVDGRLVAYCDFLYADDMEPDEFLSLDELIRRRNVVDTPVPAMNLESGMVMRCEGIVRIVISVAFEKSESGCTVIIETVEGLKKFAGDTQFDVWHINGEPFIVDGPPEDPGKYVPGGSGGSSAPPAQDAAGIVPVWRGPQKLN
jgi:hypothetical protein